MEKMRLKINEYHLSKIELLLEFVKSRELLESFPIDSELGFISSVCSSPQIFGRYSTMTKKRNYRLTSTHFQKIKDHKKSSILEDFFGEIF